MTINPHTYSRVLRTTCGKGQFCSYNSSTMAENILRIKMRKDENKKDEIKKSVCALFNSGGGKLVVKITDATNDRKIDAAVIDRIIRPIEQYFKNIITISEVHKNINRSESEHDCITLHISGLSGLCTLSTHMFLPTESEISLIPGKELDTIRAILRGGRIVEISEQKPYEQFLLGNECGMCESKTVQFKQLKTEETSSTDLVDRIMNNRFTDIISAFANASGGCIFYGIDDRGMVVGETLPNPSELKNITTKLETAVQKMVWPERSGKIERRNQWNVNFVPVKNSKNEEITLTFIIVVSVQPCAGGVFTKKPESYYVENNQVQRMPFDIWKVNVFNRVAMPMLELQRQSWSTPKEAENYMRLTVRLENYRQLAKWETIEKQYETFKKENFSVNTELVFIFQLIAVKYRQGYDVAEELLKKFREEIIKAEDKSIFEVEERYVTSAIERSQGKYKEAWDTIADGLHFIDKAPVGLITANFFAQAASVLSYAVDDESFIGVSKENMDFKKKVDRYVKCGEKFCHWALQHLVYIEDKYEIAREELKQRVYITLAALHLKLVDPGHMLASISAIENAAEMISEAEKSLIKLKGTARLKYNYCRLLIAKSDLHFKKCKLEKTVDIRLEFLKESLHYIQEVEDIATKHRFEEIKKLCKSQKEKIDEELTKIKHDQKKSNEMIVDELHSLLDEY